MQQFDGDDQDETTVPIDPDTADGDLDDGLESLDELSATEVADEETADEI